MQASRFFTFHRISQARILLKFLRTVYTNPPTGEAQMGTPDGNDMRKMMALGGVIKNCKHEGPCRHEVRSHRMFLKYLPVQKTGSSPKTVTIFPALHHPVTSNIHMSKYFRLWFRRIDSKQKLSAVKMPFFLFTPSAYPDGKGGNAGVGLRFPQSLQLTVSRAGRF